MILLAFLVASCPFTWALHSTLSATPSPICTSAICRTSLTFPTKLVPIVCVFTANCLPCRLLVAALFLTGQFLSSSAIVYFACSLIAFFTNSLARSTKESAFHIKCMSSATRSWNSKWSTFVFACRMSRLLRLLRAGLTIFVKRCCTISRDLFYVICTYSPSFIILASWWENPILYLHLIFCGRTSLGLRLIWVCVRFLMSYRRTPCRLTSSCLSQLGTSRELVSVQFTLPTPLGSIRICWHSLFAFSLLMVARGLSNQLGLGTPAYEIGWCGRVLAHWAQAFGLFAHYSTLHWQKTFQQV